MRTRVDLVDLRDIAAGWRIRAASDGLPVIPGRWGTIGAYDRARLHVFLSERCRLRALLRHLPPGWVRHQVGDAEANLLAPVTDLAMACAVVGARRQGRLSDARRAALAAGRVKFRPRSVDNRPFLTKKCPPDGQGV